MEFRVHCCRQVFRYTLLNPARLGSTAKAALRMSHAFYLRSAGLKLKDKIESHARGLHGLVF